jgi:hypothetical protein
VSLGRRLSFGHRFVGFALPSRSHRLPSGGAARVTLPPSGDRWLRRQVATATGGYGDRRLENRWKSRLDVFRKGAEVKRGCRSGRRVQVGWGSVGGHQEEVLRGGYRCRTTCC